MLTSLKLLQFWGKKMENQLTTEIRFGFVFLISHSLNTFNALKLDNKHF